MSAATVALVRHAIDAFIDGDIDEALRHASPRIVTRRAAPLPDARVYEGREGVLQAYTDWTAEFGDFEMQPGRCIDLGERVALEVMQRATGRVSGAEVRADFWLLYEIEEGLIVRFDMFATPEQALAFATNDKGGSDMTKAQELAERYTAVWMEPDGDRRRKAIADVWSEDAIHVLQPTQEVYEAAAERAVNPTWQVRGHDELEARVTSAYEDFVATGQMAFRMQNDAKRLGDVVTWRWEGVSPDGEVLGVGLEFVILAADGRIATDYQFVD